MKKTLAIVLGFAGVVGFAAVPTPEISSVVQNSDDRAVTVTYSLEADAIITMSVTYGGVSYPVCNAVGDVHRKVSAGAAKRIVWVPGAELPADFTLGEVSVNLKSWSPSTPPDYLAINTRCPTAIRYYADVASIPGGLADPINKTEWLILRKIPAKGVEWRMGMPSTAAQYGTYGSNNPLKYVTNASDYYMAVYELTQRQYKNLVGTTSMAGSIEGRTAFAGYPHHEAHLKDWEWHPARNITWAKATEIAANLAQKCGLKVSLPTSQQWEFACRGRTPNDYYNGVNAIWVANNLAAIFQTQAKYYGGAQDVAHPNYANSLPVGSLEPNCWNLYDMHANIREWCVEAVGDKHVTRSGRYSMSGEDAGSGVVVLSNENEEQMYSGMRLCCNIE